MSQKRPYESPNKNCKLPRTSSIDKDFDKPNVNINQPDTPNESQTTIDYLKSDKPFVVARFIFECGRKLEAKVLTTATAVKLLHQFNKNTQRTEYDPYLISCACLYLAGKIEDNDHLRLRDIINVAYTTIHRDREPLDLNSEYYAMRTAIVQAELLLLRILEFKTNVDHPHKYLLHYLKSLKDWISPDVWNKYPIGRTSWSLIQDAYHDSNLVVNTDHELLSIACIQLALQTYGIKVPFMSDTSDDDKAWYKVFCTTATKDKLWFIMKQLMDLYNQECIYIAPIILKENL